MAVGDGDRAIRWRERETQRTGAQREMKGEKQNSRSFLCGEWILVGIDSASSREH